MKIMTRCINRGNKNQQRIIMKTSSGKKGPGLRLTLNKDNITPIQPFLTDRNFTSSSFNSRHYQLNSGQRPISEKDIAYDNYDEGVNEKYSFPDPFVAYKIMPAQQDRMALDVTTLDIPQQQLVKNNIIIWDYHGGPNQHFYLRKADNIPGNFYFIINSSTGFTLQVPNQSLENDVQIHVNPRNNTRGQVWELIEWGKGLYKFKSFCGKVLDISHTILRNGNPVIQYSDNDGKNQKWKIWPA